MRRIALLVSVFTLAAATACAGAQRSSTGWASVSMAEQESPAAMGRASAVGFPPRMPAEAVRGTMPLAGQRRRLQR